MMSSDTVISSRQNPTVKRVCALLDKKAREAEGLFRFDGIKLFAEAVDCGLDIEGVYLRESSRDVVYSRASRELASLSNDRIICVSDAVFDKMSEERAPEGIITVAKHIDKFRKIDTIINADVPTKEKSVLLVESLRDPGNMGTVIRSAVALGIGRIVMSADCADIYNPKTIRAAMGALFTQKIYVADDMVAAITALRGEGAHVYATALNREARMLGSVELKKGDAILVGNEGHGLSNEVISASNECLFIPMEKGSESLNAGIAASICIWEIYRQTKFK